VDVVDIPQQSAVSQYQALPQIMTTRMKLKNFTVAVLISQANLFISPSKRAFASQDCLRLKEILILENINNYNKICYIYSE